MEEEANVAEEEKRKERREKKMGNRKGDRGK